MPLLLHQRTAKLGAWIDDVQQTWLGWSLPPAERAITEANWRRDDLAAYCRRCGSSVGAGEATDTGCGSCRGKPMPVAGVVRLGPYVDPLRQWIPAIKYQRWSDMAELLGRQLGVALIESKLLDVSRCVVVPMPMPWQRRIYRGIDHALAIAGATAAELRAPLLQVLAAANGTPQVGLSQTDRLRRGGRSIRLRRRPGGWGLRDIQIVLVDDVRTTGASMQRAARVLRRARPAGVIAAILAVSDDRARRDRVAATRKSQPQTGLGGRASSPSDAPELS
ncbi:MAG: ComF family protein [Planctomycetes bacterium]|nr:ComF family protein [Planctomycetota bacterium]